jgi:tetratricopeptide (TPR) repeat protein
MKFILIGLIITISLVSPPVMSASVVDNLKQMQLYLDKAQMDKVEELYDDNEATLSKNWMALERLAISFERREKYKQAIDLYRKIIIEFNRPAHEKVLNTPLQRMDPTYYEGTKLSLYYYKLAYNNTMLFTKTNEYTPGGEQKKYKKNAEGFIALARKVKTSEADLKALEEVLKEKVSKEESMRYRVNWYASLDILSWQDRVVLLTTATQVKTNLLATSIGPCLGLGKKWENVRYEFNLEGCVTMLNASVSSQDKNVNYQQSSVAVKGILVGPGMYFKTFAENVFFGLSIPIKYRTGDWTNPDEDLYKLERTSSLEAGFFLQSKIKISKFSIRTRFGKVFPNPGSLWTIGALYDF